MKATLIFALLLVAAAAAAPVTQDFEVDADFDDDAEFLSDFDVDPVADAAGPEDVTDLEQKPSSSVSASITPTSNTPATPASPARPPCVVDRKKDVISKACMTGTTANGFQDIYCIEATMTNCQTIVSAKKKACTDMPTKDSSTSPAYTLCSYDYTTKTVSDCVKTTCKKKTVCKMNNPTSDTADVSCYK